MEFFPPPSRDLGHRLLTLSTSRSLRYCAAPAFGIRAWRILACAPSRTPDYQTYIGPYSECAYNDVSALTCYNLHYAYYRILEIKARFYQEKFWICVVVYHHRAMIQKAIYSIQRAFRGNKYLHISTRARAHARTYAHPILYAWHNTHTDHTLRIYI